MDFPSDIFQNIMEYFSHPYRRPIHYDAICSDNTFADFVIDEALYYEDGETPHWSNSFIKYKKWRFDMISWRSDIIH